MTAPAKPVDLAAAMALAVWNADEGRRQTGREMRAMADEIEALRRDRDRVRAAVAKMIARVEAGEIEYGDMIAECDELRTQVLDD